MTDYQATLRELETRTDEALGSLEQDGRWAEALEIYHNAGQELDGLDIPRKDPAFRPGRKLRAYLYLREANALRALGRHAEAVPLGDLELSAAMASGDRLTIAQAMFSLGGTCVANGETARGLKLLADSKPMFEHGDDDAHRQGLGWWYIIQADLSNADLAPTTAEHALSCADTALSILRPLANWPGVARAHTARAQAYERIGDHDAARVARAAANMAVAMMGVGKQAGHA
jgi:tetratricopeptide (TPR) repeat protein